MDEDEYSKKRRMLYKVPFLVSVSMLVGFVILVFIDAYAAIVLGSFMILLVVYKSFINFPIPIYAINKIRKTMKEDYYQEIKDEYKDIFHVVLSPAYMEDKEDLYEEKIISVRQSKIADNIAVVFVLEQNDTRAQEIVRKFSGIYENVFMIVHPPEEGIVRGKSSAMAYAGKLIGSIRYGKKFEIPKAANDDVRKYTEEFINSFSELIKDKEVVVHDTDIDYWFPHNYFEYFTHVYLNTENRRHAIYQPIIALINNLDKVRFFSRNIAVSTTYESINSNFSAILRSAFSAYAVSLDLLDEVGYWRSDVIQEDSSFYWKVRTKLGKKSIKFVPMTMPVFGNAIEGSTWRKEFDAQWKQLARWGIGTSDMADIWLSDASLKEKLYSIPWWLKFHFMWETTGIIGLLTMVLSMALGYGPVPGVVYFGSYILTLLGMSISSKVLEELAYYERISMFGDEETAIFVAPQTVENAYPIQFESRFPAPMINREVATATALLIVTESSKRTIMWVDLGYIAALSVSSICALHGAYRAFKYDLKYVVAPK
jgi:hypothetical protein